MGGKGENTGGAAAADDEATGATRNTGAPGTVGGPEAARDGDVGIAVVGGSESASEEGAGDGELRGGSGSETRAPEGAAGTGEPNEGGSTVCRCA